MWVCAAEPVLLWHCFAMAMDGSANLASYDPREYQERRYMAELGQRIKRLREQRDLTQLSLAQVSAVAADMISRLENGHYQSPGLRTLLRLADGLGVPVNELLPADVSDPRPGRESSQRVRLAALLKRAAPEDLGLLADLVEAVVARTR